jgi:hypothetical protein
VLNRLSSRNQTRIQSLTAPELVENLLALGYQAPNGVALNTRMS